MINLPRIELFEIFLESTAFAIIKNILYHLLDFSKVPHFILLVFYHDFCMIHFQCRRESFVGTCNFNAFKLHQHTKKSCLTSGPHHSVFVCFFFRSPKPGFVLSYHTLAEIVGKFCDLWTHICFIGESHHSNCIVFVSVNPISRFV